MSYWRTVDPRAEHISIDPGGIRLEGELHAVDAPTGIVVLAHTAFGGHLDARTRHVATVLRDAGMATLTCDLIGAADAPREALRHDDMALMTERLVDWIDLVRGRRPFAYLPLGIIASDAAAAAALCAAARDPGRIEAVISCRGRLDLAEAVLPQVSAPVLLIVPGHEPHVLRTNRLALRRLGGAHRLEEIPGAHHLFAEPGALSLLALSARRWLRRHLVFRREARPLLALVPRAAEREAAA